jgi:hypothetical protein
MSMLTPGARTAGVAIASLLAAPVASAQSPSEADSKAIGAYVLTMPKYRQYLDAAFNLANVAAKEPEVGKPLQTLGNQPMAKQVGVLDGVPQFRGAITGAGLNARDFVLIQGAALQAGVAHMLIKNGSLTPESALEKPGVSRANLEFYQRNDVEIERLTKEYAAKTPGLPN